MNKQIVNWLKVIAIPTIYAIILRLLFGVDTWAEMFSVMSVTFLFCLPTIMGILTVYFSSLTSIASLSYCFFTPWISIMAFFIITLVMSIEGWACWLMVLPFFLIASSIGGMIGRYLKLKRTNNSVQISLIAFLPLLLAPLESVIGAIPGTYEAYNYIDINATADKIWTNVTRVKEIPSEQDSGWLTKTLGLPRPIKAELNFEGVGAYRQAMFTNGLVFHETVSEYIHQKKMVFSIKAYPHEIPSTTMDQHVVIGGKYFDVLNGTYELEKLNDTTHRLHLYSHFKLSTTFNFYASWWAKWIMMDIQSNILRVEKIRAEHKI